MALVTPAHVSFNGGELSPLMHLRVDQAVRGIAVKKMLGWLPLLQGPAEACPGTIFVAKAKGPFRLLPYEFNVTQSYQIEAGDRYLRFFTNDAQILANDGTPYEIETPWSIDQVRELYTDQSLDVLYCAHGSTPLRRLYRTSADTFAIDRHELKNGPFEARNSDQTVTVTASGATGVIDVTSSTKLFEPGDVGGLMEIEGGDFSQIPTWESGMTVAAGAIIQSNGNVYQRTGGETRTGQVAPTHIEGAEFDGSRGKDINDKGPYGVQWTYQYNRWGLIRFTEYVDPMTMRAEVIQHLPTTVPAWRWRFGAFSERRGFPEIVGVWQERLVLAKGATVYASVAGDLNDFAVRNELGDTTRDQAFTVDLPNPNQVRWMLSALGLIVGTAKAEHVLTAASTGQGAGPGNVDTATPAENGSAPGRPVTIDGRAIHVQKARAKLMQLVYDADRRGGADSPDLSRFAEHIGAVGFNELAWAKEPKRLLWARRDDGTLAVAAFMPDEALLAWATRTLGGDMVATSIATISDPAGRFEQLWVGARLDGDHLVLRMAPIRTSTDTDEQVMLDAAVRRSGIAGRGVAAPHLANRVVDVLADGVHHEGIRLDGAGNATLDAEASDVIVGLPFPAEIVFLPPEGGSENGPAIGKTKRATRIDLHYHNADAIEVICQGSRKRVNHLDVSDRFDVTTPLRSGRYQIEPRGDYDTDMEVTVRRLTPRPCTLLACMPHYEVGQR